MGDASDLADTGLRACRDRRRLVLTRHLPAPVMPRLKRAYDLWVADEDRPLTTAELVAAATGADALLVMATDRINRQVIAALPDRTSVIATLSVGHDHVDLEAARARCIAVLHTPDVLSDAVAEMGMLLMLGAARRAREGAELLQRRAWSGWSPTQLLGTDLSGKRMGIFGMGRIGRMLARRARAFNMQIHYHNRRRLPSAAEDGAVYHGAFTDLLRVSDVLVLAAPASEATRRILNAESIALMPEGGILVNIARGTLVDDKALIAALRCGRLAGAGLDVFNDEPSIHEGYYETPTAFLQPHQGSSTWGTRVRMCELLVNEIDAFFQQSAVSTRLV